MHERPLVDRVYDHYCYGELSAYSRGVEDLLSFLSLPHTRRELQEGDLSDGSYQEWCNSKQCIFTNGSKETTWVNDDEEAEELGEEDALEGRCRQIRRGRGSPRPSSFQRLIW